MVKIALCKRKIFPKSPPWSTHCAWKSTNTGSSLLMTLSVKSSLSWTLKDTSLRRVWGRARGRVRDGERKATRFGAVCRDVEKEEELMVDDGRQRISFTESVQILRTSSLWAICIKIHKIKADLHHSMWLQNSFTLVEAKAEGQLVCHNQGHLCKAGMFTGILCSWERVGSPIGFRHVQLKNKQQLTKLSLTPRL